jgi:hypothetical protein
MQHLFNRMTVACHDAKRATLVTIANNGDRMVLDCVLFPCNQFIPIYAVPSVKLYMTTKQKMK